MMYEKLITVIVHTNVYKVSLGPLSDLIIGTYQVIPAQPFQITDQYLDRPFPPLA
jgi:hypothetical protein